MGVEWQGEKGAMGPEEKFEPGRGSRIAQLCWKKVKKSEKKREDLSRWKGERRKEESHSKKEARKKALFFLL